MSRLARSLLIALALLGPLHAQKKPDPKPESAPAPAPVVAIDAELQKEIDGINVALSIKANAIAGKHFDLVGTLNPTQLQLLQEVAERAYKIFEEICEPAGGVAGPTATGAAGPAGQTPSDVLFGGRKCLIAVFNNSSQYQAFGRWYDDFYKFPYNADAMKTHTYFPYAYPRSCIATHLRPHDINMLRNVVAHEVGHICAYRYAYNNAMPPIWFVEGLATCLEGKACGTTNCYCFGGGYGDATGNAKTLVNREWSKWKAQVKATVKAKQDKAVEHLLKMKLNEMGMNETGKAMAVVDYWMNTDPAKLVRWLAVTKKNWPDKPQTDWMPAMGEAQKKALKEVFGMEWAELDEAVRKYVQAKY